MLERSGKAFNRTVESIAQATSAYNNATKMLETLENFDSELKSKQGEALKAQGFKDEINDNLKDSVELISNLKSNLKNINSTSEIIKANLAYVEASTAVFNIHMKKTKLI